MLAITLAVRLTSSGPVLFLQKRMGRHGRSFTILKFRTLIHAADRTHHAVTTAGNQHFTPIGSFLRRWKLNELPQLLNVLWGDMSLVGYCVTSEADLNLSLVQPTSVCGSVVHGEAFTEGAAASTRISAISFSGVLAVAEGLVWNPICRGSP